MPYLSGGSCKARAAHVGRCRMGRGAARRREMLLAAPPRAGDRGVVAAAPPAPARPDADGTHWTRRHSPARTARTHSTPSLTGGAIRAGHRTHAANHADAKLNED